MIRLLSSSVSSLVVFFVHIKIVFAVGYALDTLYARSHQLIYDVNKCTRVHLSALYAALRLSLILALWLCFTFVVHNYTPLPVCDGGVVCMVHVCVDDDWRVWDACSTYVVECTHRIECEMLSDV